MVWKHKRSVSYAHVRCGTPLLRKRALHESPIFGERALLICDSFADLRAGSWQSEVPGVAGEGGGRGAERQELGVWWVEQDNSVQVQHPPPPHTIQIHTHILFGLVCYKLCVCEYGVLYMECVCEYGVLV
jgi:hypothetical protein